MNLSLKTELTIEQKLELIIEAIQVERDRLGITPREFARQLPETSGELCGEIRLLVFRQLVPTKEGFGSWESEMHDPEVVDEVLEFLQNN